MPKDKWTLTLPPLDPWRSPDLGLQGQSAGSTFQTPGRPGAVALRFSEAVQLGWWREGRAGFHPISLSPLRGLRPLPPGWDLSWVRFVGFCCHLVAEVTCRTAWPRRVGWPTKSGKFTGSCGMQLGDVQKAGSLHSVAPRVKAAKAGCGEGNPSCPRETALDLALSRMHMIIKLTGV